jgi:hypothetical protein
LDKGEQMANVNFKVKNSIDLGSPLTIANGGTGQTTAVLAINALVPTQTGNATKVLTTDGTIVSWGTASGGGASITDDTATNATRYITFANATSGTFSTAFVSSTKLYYNPSTGTLNATNFNSLSDLQFKTDVRLIDNALNIVNSLDGVAFNWKDTGVQSYGVIAQEIEEVIPALVEINDAGIRSVNYNGLIGFLIEAVKTLSAKVDELESR